MAAPDALLAPLREAPERSALLFDLDGVLAPIVPRPELAAVPDGVRAELARLAARYCLVACVTGRVSGDAERLVGVPGIEYVGTHGLELDEAAVAFAPALARFRDEVGLEVEDKGLTLTYHYREAADEAAARVELEAVADAARGAGLEPRWGRKVLEIRPPVPADKGTATRLLVARSGAGRALYAGDDTTDLDAFIGLEEAGLDYAVRVAVVSAEGPHELFDAADVLVAGTGEVLELLRAL